MSSCHLWVPVVKSCHFLAKEEEDFALRLFILRCGLLVGNILENKTILFTKLESAQRSNAEYKFYFLCLFHLVGRS